MRLFPEPDRNIPPGDNPRTPLGSQGPYGKNVVVCDDERHIVRLIQVNLERNGCTVRTAFNGQDCLEMVRDKCPDLLILDQEMPYMSGEQVIQIIRADPATEHLKIVLMTKSSDRPSDGPTWPAGPTAVISKPFNPVEMMRLLG